jgi:hypothetical protein
MAGGPGSLRIESPEIGRMGECTVREWVHPDDNEVNAKIFLYKLN